MKKKFFMHFFTYLKKKITESYIGNPYFYKRKFENEGWWRVKSCRIPKRTAGIETSRCSGTWKYLSDYSSDQYLGSYMHMHVQLVKKTLIFNANTLLAYVYTGESLQLHREILTFYIGKSQRKKMYGRVTFAILLRFYWFFLGERQTVVSFSSLKEFPKNIFAVTS